MSELQPFLPDLEWYSQHGESLRCILRDWHHHNYTLSVAASRTRNWLMIASIWGFHRPGYDQALSIGITTLNPTVTLLGPYLLRSE